MKCELTAALLHRPKVLFLDEPTIGLDVTMQDVVRRFIRDYNERTGATVLLTSHYMDDVAALCPRVIVIDQGRIKHDGELKELTEKISPDKLIHATLARPVPKEELDRLAVNGAPLRIDPKSETLLTLAVSPAALTETVKILLHELPIADLRVEDPPLEDVMRQFFGA
jgi:ABC-2 type transport system ATP-binding protein